MQGGNPSGGRHIIAALDIGSTKITCFIGKPMTGRSRWTEDGQRAQMRIMGVGYQPASGVRAGAIVDMEAAEGAIRAAVDQAERMARVTIDSVEASLSCGRIGGESFEVESTIAGEQVTDKDVQSLLTAGYEYAQVKGRAIMHVMPMDFSLDGNRSIQDPRGLYGKTLRANIHVVSTDAGAIRNLKACIERCHLVVDNFVAVPYVSGLAVLLPDELRLGVINLDMGGERTNAAVFHKGKLVFVTSVALGGHHITTDIARGLSTSIAHAERLKTFYGSALVSSQDEREFVAVPAIGDNDETEVNRIPKSMLTGIIQPRLEEIFEMIRDRLEENGFGSGGDSGIVLSGGASQLTGARELAARAFNQQVRKGQPQYVSGLPEAARGPAFSACAGLLLHSQVPEFRFDQRQFSQLQRAGSGYLARVGNWLRENF
jgi:cell division protein FtsA